MIDRKTVFKLHTSWNIEKETDWLQMMSKDGWLLEGYAWGFYRFVAGPGESCVYEIDFALSGDFDMLCGLYRDAGWQHVVSFANWHYFRIAQSEEGAKPAYTDLESKRGKLARILTVLIVAVLPMIFFGIVNPVLNGYVAKSGIYYGILIFSSVITAVCLYGAVRIWMRMRKLPRN